MLEHSYPNLQRIYIQRAKEQQKKNLRLFLGSAMVVVLFTINGLPHRVKSLVFLVVMAILAIISAGRLISLTHGLKNFKSAWRAQLETLDVPALTLCEAVEADLKDEVSYFKEVIITSKYLIAFKEIGSFAMIRAIELIELEEHVQAYGLFRNKTYHTLSCTVEPIGKVLISQSLKEMPEILDLIRSRYPDVAFNEEARWQFFPPEGWQT
jgi:hypothetical protein